MQEQIKQAQSSANISSEENRYRTIIENLLDCAVTIDANGIIQSFNKAGEKMFGWDRKELIGKNIKVLMPEPYRGNHDGYLQHFHQTGDEKIMGQIREFEAIRKDGTTFPIELSVTYNQVGDHVYFHGVIRDISLRKEAETQIIKHQQALIRSNQELEKFAYIASHDLQEPLRKVQAFCDRLVESYRDKLEGRGLDYIDRMSNAATRMRTLISDLLVFSRVSTKGAEFIRTNLNDELLSVLEDLEILIKETSARITYDTLPVIDADALQIRQLFQNLIGNAIKFHKPDTRPEVKISCEIIKDVDVNGFTAQMCRISIRDNGIGFSQEYADRIFEVFQRLHSRTSYEGTGIGLAICRRIVERHGGTISAQGKPDSGAEFSFTLHLQH